MKDRNIVYDKQKKDKDLVRWQMKFDYKEQPLTGPLRIDLVFRMAIPKSTSGVRKRQMIHGVIHHMKKPDIDNLTKFIFDCMNDLVFKDDAQICELNVKKIYSEYPSTLIKITALQEDNNQQKEEEADDGDHPRKAGRGDVPRDRPQRKRAGEVERAKNRVIPFLYEAGSH
jgi:Holliday junction resolvase RusA-like endonuclease